jgi:uncharacterized protein YpmS
LELGLQEIFRFNNIVFYFYSQDHEPVHVHIRQAGKNVVIVIDALEVKNNKGFRSNEIRLLQEKVNEYKILIKEVWYEYFEEKED